MYNEYTWRLLFIDIILVCLCYANMYLVYTVMNGIIQS